MSEMTSDVERRLYTPEEAAKSLNMSRTTLYGYLSSGELRSLKLGTLRRIPAQELDRFVKTRLLDPEQGRAA